jgi:hypothetical protein
VEGRLLRLMERHRFGPIGELPIAEQARFSPLADGAR